MLLKHQSANSQLKLLCDAALVRVIVFGVKTERFATAWAANEKMPLIWHLVSPIQISFFHQVLLGIHEVVKVKGRDIDVREESIIVE